MCSRDPDRDVAIGKSFVCNVSLGPTVAIRAMVGKPGSQLGVEPGGGGAGRKLRGCDGSLGTLTAILRLGSLLFTTFRWDPGGVLAPAGGEVSKKKKARSV